ncbi:hypothetical protein CWI38_2319p0010, partial [Hamiltosporidium tvaerminnensis]
MQNSGFDTLPSPNTPLPSSVEISACEPSYDMTNPFTIAILGGMASNCFFLQYRQGLKECQEMARQSFTGTQSEMGTEVISEDNLERHKFLSKIKEISEKEIGEVMVRTRKHPDKLVNKVLDLI